MDRNGLDRRQFQHLLGAAFGGLMTGATIGCSGSDGKGSAGGGSAAGSGAAGSAATASGSAGAGAVAKHACRGLNVCKGQGADGKNACAGQGTCANVTAHACATMNECKGLGGCGKTAGANECKGKGGCQVPMHEGAWETARAHFETEMKKHSKTFGTAPPRPAAKS